MSSRKLHFDGWVLDPESGELERAGIRIRLQEQPVQVLRELIAHAGSVVPREQLIALLWPKGVVDFDTGLNTVIRKLRSALGDTSETPRYIETLPRRGYRFIAPLDPEPERVAPQASVQDLPARRPASLAAISPGSAASDEDSSPPASNAGPQGDVGSRAGQLPLHWRVFEQLKQRNVFRVGALYLAVSWLILNPLHTVFHILQLDWANRLMVLLMAMGLPLALVFAWVYEITPQGLQPTVEVAHSQSIRALTGRRLDRAIIAVLALVLAYFLADKFWISKHFSATQAAASTARETDQHANPAAAAFSPPPHSIVVLPFVNMSGDASQEYFSDGVTEELLNSLARIKELQVAGRSSAFYFKDEHADLTTIARKLNVAAVLEGSVRRSAHRVRVTARLTSAVTGFHLWSETYDRDPGDILRLQSEIADAVAAALKLTLLGNVQEKIEMGGTRRPAAFDAYLRGVKAYNTAHGPEDFQAAIAAHTDAIRLDPDYALAFAGRSRMRSLYIGRFVNPQLAREDFRQAEADARRAIELAPDLAEGHLALGTFFAISWLDYVRALEEYQRAVVLAPGNAEVLRAYGRFAARVGRADAGLGALRRAIVLDPLNRNGHVDLGLSLRNSRQFQESIRAFRDALAIDPGDPLTEANLGVGYYALGNFEAARTSCSIASSVWPVHLCLAMTYAKLGRQADAETELTKVRATLGDGGAYEYARIYTQWGNSTKALECLETALRVRDPGLVGLRTDIFLDPLRKEPRFQAIERALKFPN